MFVAFVLAWYKYIRVYTFCQPESLERKIMTEEINTKNIEEISNAAQAYLECESKIRSEQQHQKAIKLFIEKTMTKLEINEIDTEIAKITRTKESKSPKFDTKALIALMASSKDIRTVLSPHMGETVRKPSIAIKRK